MRAEDYISDPHELDGINQRRAIGEAYRRGDEPDIECVEGISNPLDDTDERGDFVYVVRYGGVEVGTIEEHDNSITAYADGEQIEARRPAVARMGDATIAFPLVEFRSLDQAAAALVERATPEWAR